MQIERKEKDGYNFHSLLFQQNQNHEHCHLTIEAIILCNYHILWSNKGILFKNNILSKDFVKVSPKSNLDSTT